MSEWKLYQTSIELENAFNAAVDEDTGEVKDEEALRNYEKLLAKNAENIEDAALTAKNLKAYYDAVKIERDKLSANMTAAWNKREKTIQAIKFALKGEKLKTSKVNIYYSTSTSTDVPDPRAVPEEYQKVTIEANKEMIKKAIKEGREVPGATLVTKTNLIIK